MVVVPRGTDVYIPRGCVRPPSLRCRLSFSTFVGNVGDLVYRSRGPVSRSKIGFGPFVSSLPNRP